MTIVGAGYVGLVTGVSLAVDGHHVTFVEAEVGRRSELTAGTVPIEEPGLAEAFQQHRDSIAVVERIGDAVSDSDFTFVAVGTPISDIGEPDLTQLRSALDGLRDCPAAHVSVRSTLPPGTSLRLPALMGRSSSERISTNPEFLRQGTALHDYRNPTRVVIGRFADTSQEHLERLDELLGALEAPRLRVDVTTAELVKNVANGFLALKLSFVNEVAALSEEYGVDVQDVLDGIAFDPRIGSSYMRPGLGFGGSCLPKELQVLAAAGRRKGIPMHVARAAAQVNMEQQDRFVRQLLRGLPPGGGRVALLGLSFKADTDDLRGSPSIHVARRLMDAGHEVVAHDPAVRPDRARSAAPGIEVVADPLEACDGADAVVIGTEWPLYRELPLERVAARLRQPLIFDGRNIIDPDRAGAAGLTYTGVGRRRVEAARPGDTLVGPRRPED
ncbi:MAG: nucleotide sugar dehydrogenase [Chloroflexi bacterium]|nr:nucleotide sugar dehydrogenase [Chloroflexota bacterium]